MSHSSLVIRPLSPELLPDFLTYFDGEAFADNPQWSSCFCQFLYVDHAQVQWSTRSADENRSAACDRICSSRMQGYLAYRDNIPVGWCNAAPRRLLDAFVNKPDPDTERLGQITCFVVAKGHRRTGVAKALLNAACEGFKQQGLTIAEAAPRPDAGSDAQHFHGPLSLFLDAGFEIHRTAKDGTVIVRRRLC